MVKSTLFWIPRMLGVLFALFISAFALDVFSVSEPISEVLLAFLIHLIPTAIVLVVFFIATRNGWIGGVLFILIGGAYIYQMFGYRWEISLVFGGTPILIGFLFILEGFYYLMEHKSVAQDASEGDE